MLRKINSLIVDAVNKQAATKEAELKSLKNQIDSHFLYNTLENLKMLAEIDAQYTISDALTSLGGMMRYNLKWTSDYVRLKDEITHCINYISIMDIRFNGCLKLEMDIPQEHLEQEVLKMSLQPIVENAVKHGMKTDLGEMIAMLITIKTYSHSHMTIIEVTDNGSGINELEMEKLNRKINMSDIEFNQMYKNSFPLEGEGSGIGLRNVNQRIQLNYGKNYGIRIESSEGFYTRVTINLPYFILSGGMLNETNIIDR
jgi:two-component system sensor histidine kinase YesM